MDEGPPARTGDVGLIPGLESFHMPWSEEACAPQLLSIWSRARMLSTEAHAPPATGEATAMRNLGTTTRRCSLLAATRESPHSGRKIQSNQNKPIPQYHSWTQVDKNGLPTQQTTIKNTMKGLYSGPHFLLWFIAITSYSFWISCSAAFLWLSKKIYNPV